MKYLMLIYRDEAAFPPPRAGDDGGMSAAYMTFTQALRDSGVLVGGERLAPIGNATTVRSPNGKVQVLDGPYAETKEQLGGYYMIDVPDLDAALLWAKKCPGASQGSIELRPIVAM
jgi:hypothetical protein